MQYVEVRFRDIKRLLFSTGCKMDDNTIRMFKDCLFKAFNDWIETNKASIGEKWYEDLQKKSGDAEAECNTALKIMGSAMWVFNMLGQFGVGAGLHPNGYNLQYLHNGLDEASTKRLLALCSSCLCLQYLPLDIMKREFPIISKKKFSLQLYVQQQT